MKAKLTKVLSLVLVVIMAMGLMTGTFHVAKLWIQIVRKKKYCPIPDATSERV